MDVYMLVLKIQFASPSYMKLKVEWFAHGSSLKIKQNLKLNRADLKHWRPV